MDSTADLKSFLKGLPALSDKNKEKRLQRAKNSLFYFAKTYFSHYVAPKEDSNLFSKYKETSKFRRFFYLHTAHLFEKKTLIEAYRGAAKTTLLRITLLYALLCKERSYCFWVSSNATLASECLEALKAELESNERLKRDFNIEVGGAWRGKEATFFTDKNYKKIRVCGAGEKIRGANYRGKRPDFIVCDDIEDDEKVQNKTQRDKLYSWLNKALLKLPSRIDKSSIIVSGTALHYDGLIKRVEGREDFNVFKFPLILSFPELQSIDKDNIDKADLANMLLDDSRIDKAEILKEYFDDPASVSSEYQNEPLSTELALFKNYKEFETFPPCDAYCIGVDPALGKLKGDYFGITILGYKKENKLFYAQSFGYKIPPQDTIPIIINLYHQYFLQNKPISIAAEAVQFQEFYISQLKKEAAQRGIFLHINPIKNSKAKELRIDTLATPLHEGTLLIHASSFLLKEELQTYPLCPHDDLLDSLEMAYRNLCLKIKWDYNAIKQAFKEGDFNFRRMKYEL